MIHRTVGLRRRTHVYAATLLASLPLCVPLDAGAQDDATQRHDATPTLPRVDVTGVAATDARSEDSDAYLAPTVTVGGKQAVPVLEIPQSVSVITRRRIEDQNMVTIDDALREVTGVTVSPWDGVVSQYRSRGYFLEPSYDGIPAYGGLDQTEQYDLAMYDRIEVLRGPAGLFQGSGQPGGSVNFARKRGRAEFGGSFAASAGSWSNYYAEADVGGPLDTEGRVRTRLVAAARDRDFFYDRAHQRSGMVYGTIDVDVSARTTVSAWIAHQDQRTSPFSGLPTYIDGRQLDAPRSTNPTPEWAYYEAVNTTVAGEIDHRLENGWRLRTRLSHSERDYPIRDAYPTGGINPATGLVTYGRRGWDYEATRDALDVYLSGQFAAFGREHALTLGANTERYAGKTFYGTQDTIANVPFLDPGRVPAVTIPPFVRGYQDVTRQTGLYGQTRLAIADPLTLVLGGRLSNFQVRSRNIAPSAITPWRTGGREMGAFTPQAGLIWKLTPNTAAYVNYADIFMPQTARQASGEVLPPREGKQIEAGVKTSLFDDRLLATAAVFRTRDVNRSMPDTANPGFFMPAGEVEVKGWETEVTGSPLPGLDLSLGYTRLMSSYLTHQTLGGAAFSLFEPAHTVKAYAHYRLPGGDWTVGGGGMLSSGAVGSGVAGLREQGGYLVLNAQLGYRIDARTTVMLAIDNLLDRRYYARIGGLNSYNTYGEPRAVSLSVRTRF